MSVVASPERRLPPVAEAESIRPLKLPAPPSGGHSIPLVELCYDMVHAAEAVGIRDLADGEFRPGDTLEQGINRQLEYLLDEVGCTEPGFRLLEIGSGYGHLLQLTKARGARAVGVNVSPLQVNDCRRQGLEVHCCSYRDLLDAPAWKGQFDGIIANGTLEHWVQPEDVQRGEMDGIYRESFCLMHDLLDPDRPDARYVTTAIHVKRDVSPEDLLTPWHKHPRGSNERHYSLLHNWMGGYYPADGQLKRCAAPYFTLEKEVDGTAGYKTANDLRMARMLRGLYTNPRLIGRLLRSLCKHPKEALTMLECYYIEQSWDWQFRGDDPPMKLLRHTWRKGESGVGN